MSTVQGPSPFLLCVKNDGYPASLEVRKVYQALDDADAARHGFVRVVDESGDDYLYSADYFVSVNPAECIGLLKRNSSGFARQGVAFRYQENVGVFRASISWT